MATILDAAKGVGSTVALGGAAGDKVVPGIETGNTLITVTEFSADLVTRNDKTSEYSITDVGVINNGGGTSDNGNFLLVAWQED